MSKPWQEKVRKESGSLETSVSNEPSGITAVRWLAARALLGEPLAQVLPALEAIRSEPPTNKQTAEFAEGARLAAAALILGEDPGIWVQKSLAIANAWPRESIKSDHLEILLGIHTLLRQESERRACWEARIRLPMPEVVETLSFEVLYQSQPLAAEDPLPLRTASLCRSVCETLFSSPLEELSPHVLLLGSLGLPDLAAAMHEAFRVICSLPDTESGRGTQDRITLGTPTLALDSESGPPQLILPLHGSGELHPAVWPLAPITSRLAGTFETVFKRARARRSRRVQDLWKQMKSREPFHLDAVVRLDRGIAFDHAWLGAYSRRFRVAFENMCHLLPCPPGQSKLHVEIDAEKPGGVA